MKKITVRRLVDIKKMVAELHDTPGYEIIGLISNLSESISRVTAENP